MFEIVTMIRMLEPRIHAVRIARHFEHQVSVHRESHLVRIHFPDATCEMRMSDEILYVHIQSRAYRNLARCRDLIIRNLQQVAAREHFEVVWTGDLEDPTPTEATPAESADVLDIARALRRVHRAGIDVSAVQAGSASRPIASA